MKQLLRRFFTLGFTFFAITLITTSSAVAAGSHPVDPEQTHCDRRGECRAGYVCESVGNLCRRIAECASHSECNDGLFCNGLEECNSTGTCVPGPRACDADQTCSEAADMCEGGFALCPDVDGDGYKDIACGGGDCDDGDPYNFPGNIEICDPFFSDQDCDPSTHGFRDADGDGFGDASCG